MTMVASFRTQARNNAWANEVLGAACAALSSEEFAAPRPGFFGSLKATLNHIRLVDLYYFDAMSSGGVGEAVFDAEDEGDAAKHADLQAEIDLRLIGFCDQLDEVDANQIIAIQRRDGPVEERLDMLLLHLFQHQVHHRGQAHVMLSHAGAAPPQLDDFFLEHGRVDSARKYWS